MKFPSSHMEIRGKSHDMLNPECIYYIILKISDTLVEALVHVTLEPATPNRWHQKVIVTKFLPRSRIAVCIRFLPINIHIHILCRESESESRISKCHLKHFRHALDSTAFVHSKSLPGSIGSKLSATARSLTTLHERRIEVTLNGAKSASATAHRTIRHHSHT